MEEGTSRARIGLDGALTAGLAVPAGALAHVCEPGIDIGGVDLAHQGDPALLLQVRPHEPEGSTVPLQGLGAVVASLMVEQVVLDRSRHRGAGAAVLQQPLLLFLPTCFLERRGFRHLFGSRLVRPCLRIQLGSLGCGTRLGHAGSTHRCSVPFRCCMVLRFFRCHVLCLLWLLMGLEATGRRYDSRQDVEGSVLRRGRVSRPKRQGVASWRRQDVAR